MNVVMIVVDTLRQDHIGAYGNKWIKTPHLDRFAADSAVFTRASGEALPTIPYRRSVHTGMRTFPFRKSYYDEGRTPNLAKLNLGPAARERLPKGRQRGGFFLGVPNMALPGWEPIPSDQITIAELLQLYGYETALVTDTGPYWGRPMSLVEMNFHRGFQSWDFVRGNEGDHGPSLGALLSGEGKSGLTQQELERYVPPKMRDSWEARTLVRKLRTTAKWKDEEDFLVWQMWRRATDWVDANHGSDKPFFLWVDCWEPHEPFIVPKSYADLYDTPDYDGIEPVQPKYGSIDYLSERELWRTRALYAASVTFMDKCLGIFMDKLRSLGMLDDTMVCVTADHGFQLGEHGVTGKMPQRMWKDLHAIPFMIRHPKGMGAGKQFDAFVQGQDFYPTILDFLGIPDPYQLDGKNVLPVLRGEKSKIRDYVTCGFDHNVRAVDDEYSFISTISGDEPQLRDLRNDPTERDEVAESQPKVVKRMYDYVMEDAGRQPILQDWQSHGGGSSDIWMLGKDTPPLGPAIRADKFGS